MEDNSTNNMNVFIFSPSSLPPSSFLFLLHFGFISVHFVGLISMILVKIRRPPEFPFIKPVFTPEQL